MTTAIDQTNFESAVAQQYDGAPATNQGWTDLLGSSASARALDGKVLTTVAHPYSADTAVTFAGDDFTPTAIFYATVQTDHRMALNQVVAEHIHFTLNTLPTATDRNIKFKIYIIGAGVKQPWTLLVDGDSATDVGDVISGQVEIDLYVDEANKVPLQAHWLSELLDCPAINTTVSSMYKIRIERMTASANAYTGKLLLDYFDGHIKIDQERGSPSEYLKGTEV